MKLGVLHKNPNLLKNGVTARKRQLVDPHYIWDYFGNFSNIKSVAKFSARVGLLLSSTRHVEFIPDSRWRMESDIVRNGFEFTDGCGRMSTRIAQKFVRKTGRYQHLEYKVPSVIQIRIMGCKDAVF